MSLIFKALVLLFVLIGSVEAAPRIFSAGGSKGLYYEVFLLYSEPTELHDNHFAVVRWIDNTGEVWDGEWIVNCNEGNPQVLSPSNKTVYIDTLSEPGNATRGSYDLWWTICRNQYMKFSDRTPDRLLVSPGELVSFIHDKKTINVSVMSLGKAALMSNLAKVQIYGWVKTKKPETVFVYCAHGIPTVTWPGKHIELSPSAPLPDDPDLYELSMKLYLALCDE